MKGRTANAQHKNGGVHPKKLAKGGKAYSGGDSNVAKEAKERADGGKVTYAGAGSKVAKEAMEKKRGGKVHMKVSGHAAKHNLAHRARGGRASGGPALAASSVHNPLSAAGKTSNRSNSEGG